MLIGNGEGHGVGTGVKGVSGVLFGAGIAIAEFPVPGVDGVIPGDGLIGKLDLQRSAAAGDIGGEVSCWAFVNDYIMALALDLRRRIAIGHGECHGVRARCIVVDCRILECGRVIPTVSVATAKIPTVRIRWLSSGCSISEYCVIAVAYGIKAEVNYERSCNDNISRLGALRAYVVGAVRRASPSRGSIYIPHYQDVPHLEKHPVRPVDGSHQVGLTAAAAMIADYVAHPIRLFQHSALVQIRHDDDAEGVLSVEVQAHIDVTGDGFSQRIVAGRYVERYAIDFHIVGRAPVDTARPLGGSWCFYRTVAADGRSTCSRLQYYGLACAGCRAGPVIDRQSHGVVAGTAVVVHRVLDAAGAAVAEVPLVSVASYPARAQVTKGNANVCCGRAERTHRIIEIGNQGRFIGPVDCCLVNHRPVTRYLPEYF